MRTNKELLLAAARYLFVDDEFIRYTYEWHSGDMELYIVETHDNGYSDWRSWSPLMDDADAFCLLAKLTRAYFNHIREESLVFEYYIGLQRYTITEKVDDDDVNTALRYAIVKAFIHQNEESTK